MKALQIWEYPARQPSLNDVIAFAQETGFDTILAKGLEGTFFHGEYTDGPDYIHAPEDAVEYTERCHGAGLQYHVWCVPRPNVNMDIQAHMMAELAEGSDGLWIDAEPYPAFWGIQPEETVRDLMGRVRQYAGNRLLVLQPDPRPARFAELRGEVWMEYCDVMSGQHYWSDFWPPSDQTDALHELQHAQEYADAFGKPVWPTCPSNCPTDNLSEVVLNHLSKFSGFAVFRAGSGPDENFRRYGAVQPADSVLPVSEIDQLRTDNEFYRTVLGTIRAETVPGLKGEAARKSGVRRSQINGIANSLDNLIKGALG